VVLTGIVCFVICIYGICISSFYSFIRRWSTAVRTALLCCSNISGSKYWVEVLCSSLSLLVISYVALRVCSVCVLKTDSVSAGSG